MHLRRTIRFKFAMLGLLVILVSSAVTSTIGYSIAREAVERKIEEFDLVNLVRSKAWQIETRLARGIESSINLAHDAALSGWFRSGERNATFGAMARQNMKMVAAKGNYANVFAASFVTRAFWTERMDLPADILSIDDPDDTWFFRTLSEKKPFNLNIDYNRQLDDTFIFVNALMGDPENPAGVAGVGIELSSFAREFTISDGYGGRNWLVDAAGRIQIARDLDLIGRDATEVFGRRIAERLRENGESVKIVKSPAGEGMADEETYVASARVPSAGWTVVYQIASANLEGVLDTIRLSMLVGVAISGILVIILFLLGFTTVMAPLKELADAMRLFGSGDLSQRVQVVVRDEIGRIGTRFNEMAETLQKYNTELEVMIRDRTSQLVEAEKMASLGELVAGVAHEINTPVGIGVTAVTDAQRRLVTVRQDFAEGTLTKRALGDWLENATSALDMTRSNLERAAELVQSFKQVAVDRATDEKREIRLKEYVEEVLRSLNPRFRKTPYTVSVAGPDDLVIATHPGGLSQVLTNLVINSLVHGFENRDSGHIAIEIVREGGRHVVLHYSDDGCGIAPEHLGRIYEPFFTTKRGVGGSGLGLNIVYNIVTHSLGGTLVCKSALGAGVRFAIRLPVDKDGVA